MAGRIPREFIDELVARSDIVQVIDQSVPLKKQGANFVACCPFHDEKTPSFSVSPTKQMYYCFGCGAGGNIISFMMEHGHYGFIDAIEQLASAAGMDIPRDGDAPRPKVDHDLYEIMKVASQFFQAQLREQAGQVAIDYLKQRGLSGEIAKRFGIGYALPEWDALIKYCAKHKITKQSLINTGMVIEKDNGHGYDRFRDRVMFPIRDKQGRYIAFGGRVLGDGTPKYLNSPETPIFHKGNELYGLYEVLEAHRHPEQIVIVEGYMDVVALAQHGVDFAVATLGTATSKTHIQQLLRYSKRVICCFDGDKAGRAAAWRALENSLSVISDGVDLRFVFLPQGEDPDSFIRQHGHAAFLNLLDKANPFSDVFFAHLSEDIDMSAMAGKSQMVKAALPLLAKLPEGAMRLMLFETLGQMVRISADRLQSMMHELRESHINRQMVQKETEQKQQIIKLSKHERLAIALIIQNPNLAPELVLPSYFIEGEPAQRFIARLLEVIGRQEAMTTARLLERWRQHPINDILNELAHWQHHVPSEGLAAELQGAIDRIGEQHHSKQVQALMQKAKMEGLSAEERQQLQALIRANKAAQQA